MEFEEFAQKIARAAEHKSGGRARIHEVLKTNGVKRTGLMITGQGTCISPVVYLEKYYEDFCAGKDFDRAVSDIIEDCRHGEKAEIDINDFLDWGRARGRVLVKLVNYNANRELLKAVPHRRFLDLAEVYYAVMDIGGGQGMGSILICNMHLEMWGIGKAELAETAYANYRRHLPVEIKSMSQIAAELTGSSLPGECIPDMQEMYVVTNSWKQNGAAVMLFPEMLQEAADRLSGDMYILPSSVHEVILLSANMGEEEGLKEIVKEVNRTQIAPEEKLSDCVYRYYSAVERVEFA